MIDSRSKSKRVAVKTKPQARSPEDYFCLTSHGSFLTIDPKTGELGKGLWPELSMADLARARWNAGHPGSAPSVSFFSAYEPLGEPRTVARFEVRSAETGRLCRLHNGFGYLAAWPDGPPLPNSSNPGLWETFLLICEQELLELLTVGRERWWSDAGGCVKGEENPFRPEFKASVLGHAIDLSHAHPLGARGYVLDEPDGHRLVEFVLLSDGWRFAGHFKLWRPLVYFTAFGSEATFEQLRLSMTTLMEFGRYDGDVAVISNRDRSFIERYAPAAFHHRLRVIPCQAVDYIDYCLARYRVVEDPRAFDYGPLLYVDTDIAFDAPLDPILQHVRSASALVAAQEAVFPRDADTVGAFLFREADVDPEGAFGFNAGCLGVPDLARFEWFYRAVIDVAEAYMTCRGRSALWLADQPVTNYLAHLAKMFDPDPLTEATRVGDVGVSAANANRRGFVHFWLVRGQDAKRDAMSAYLQALRDADLPRD